MTEKTKSFIKENLKWIIAVGFFIIISIIFYYLMYENDKRSEYMEKLELFFLPLEILSLLLSIFIIKEVSEIKKDYQKKAARDIFKKELTLETELDFYISYNQFKKSIYMIKYNSNSLEEMKKNSEKLEKIDPFLSKFPKVAMDKYNEDYKKNYDHYKDSLENFEDKHFENNIELINGAKICAENIEKNDDIITRFEKYYSTIQEEIEEKKQEDAELIDDEDL